MIEMGYEENDASLIPEIQEMLDEFTKTYEGIRIKTLLSGEYDSDGAIVSLMQEPEARSPVTGGNALPHVYKMGIGQRIFCGGFRFP